VSLNYEEIKRHYSETGSEFYKHLFESVEVNINTGDPSIICCPQNLYIDSEEKHLTLYFFLEDRLIKFTRLDSQTVILNSVRYKDFIDVMLTQTNYHIMLEIRTSSGMKFHLYSDSTTEDQMDKLGKQIQESAKLII
jgi:imidazoleglycerol phosphate dehydratase HisB